MNIMLNSLESARLYLQKRNDERYITRKNRKVAAVERDLEQFTAGLDINEKIVFSTAYRFSKGVPTVSDRDLMEAIGPAIETKLFDLLGAITLHKETLTPDILWNLIPNLDPNSIRRGEIKSRRADNTEIIVFDRSQIASLIPKAA